MDATREALAVVWRVPTGSLRRTGRAVRGGGEALVPGKRGNAGRGKGLGSRGAQEGGREMGTGESLTAPDRAWRLQAALIGRVL